jgi:alpha-L-arabinofuranosidase
MKTFDRFARLSFALATVVGVSFAAHAAEPIQITVQTAQPGVKISPDLYGLMTEEINHAYDGGLYGELIQNRIFKDHGNDPAHWSVVQTGGGTGSIAIDKENPVNAALSSSLKLTIDSASAGGSVGVANDGFWGIPVRPNTPYKASFFAQAADGFSGPLTVAIVSDSGAVQASGTVSEVGAAWKRYEVTLKTGALTPSLNNRFVITGAHTGTVRFSLVSLFPPTYKNRANGNRIDLMEKIGAMKPAFLRLPGGNYLDPGHYQWKITIGPVDQRPGDNGAWGYRTSDGLGMLEYLEWCEDLNMQPLLAVTDGRPWLAPNGDVAPLVQDALDEIEYVTGDSKTTKWGAVRAKDGHPAPFPLKYVEIGNEDFFDKLPVYNARFTKFFDAIRARYPKLQIISTVPGITSRVPDIIDEHYYRSAADMENHAHQYDAYKRTGPKIFVGEWASTEGSPTPTMQAALGDAAWLTGMERNADIVILESYAPLLVNVNPGARQWGTNLIGYDALHSFGSPSYYVQKMFATYGGDRSLPTTVTQSNGAASPIPMPRGAIGVGTWATQAEFKNITVTHGAETLYKADLATGAAGWKEPSGQWKAEGGVLAQSSDATDVRATVGNPAWTDYTLHLQARKTGGAEGFLVLFHVQDDDHFLWWNVGGWGNTRIALEKAAGGMKQVIGPSADMSVETGHWYDVRVEVKGRNIRCYLDDKLIEEVTDAPLPSPLPVYASTVRDTTTGDLLLRVVNTAATEEAIRIDLAGAKRIGKTATGEYIEGDPKAVNSVENPTGIAPKPVTINNAGPQFTHAFPAHSVTILRLKTK